MKKQALFSVLSKKLLDQEIKILEKIELKELKTKNFARILKNFFAKPVSLFYIPEKDNRQLSRAGRNIDKINFGQPTSLNIIDLLSHKFVFIEKNAIPQIVEHYLGNKNQNGKNTSK